MPSTPSTRKISQHAKAAIQAFVAVEAISVSMKTRLNNNSTVAAACKAAA